MAVANKEKKNSVRQQYRYATEGSAARQVEYIPERKQGGQSPAKRTNAPQQRRKKQVVAKARPVNGLSLFVLGCVILGVIYTCANYVQLRAEALVHLETISTYEMELAELIARNNEIEANINNYVDLQYVYQVATEELGMRYPQKNQVSEYQNSDSEYVRQYREIPELHGN